MFHVSKTQILDKRMTEKDISEHGSSVRMFDGSTYKISGTYCVHELFQIKRHLTECYGDIRNVKNSNGIIIGKRKNAHSKLCFTSDAFEPIKKEKETNFYSRPKIQRKFKQPLRPHIKNGRAKKVSVLLHQTGFSDLNALKEALLVKGAKEVRFYRTKVGVSVVCHPDWMLKDLIKEQ